MHSLYTVATNGGSRNNLVEDSSLYRTDSDVEESVATSPSLFGNGGGSSAGNGSTINDNDDASLDTRTASGNLLGGGDMPGGKDNISGENEEDEVIVVTFDNGIRLGIGPPNANDISTMTDNIGPPSALPLRARDTGTMTEINLPMLTGNLPTPEKERELERHQRKNNPSPKSYKKDSSSPTSTDPESLAPLSSPRASEGAGFHHSQQVGGISGTVCALSPFFSISLMSPRCFAIWIAALAVVILLAAALSIVFARGAL